MRAGVAVRLRVAWVRHHGTARISCSRFAREALSARENPQNVACDARRLAENEVGSLRDDRRVDSHFAYGCSSRALSLKESQKGNTPFD